jgi:DNA repair protein RadA/Sms
MGKVKTVFSCQTCGYQSAKWLGRCPECGGWNTLAEEIISPAEAFRSPHSLWEQQSLPRALSDITLSEEERVPTRISEFDRVLGGGIVPGSMVLIGGDPGIGKSTLLLQAVAGLGRDGKKVLYVSGEESLRQVKMRAERLGVEGAGLLVHAEISVDAIIKTIVELSPQAVVIDSIQTVYMPELQSAPGTVSQVRESSARLMQVAKRTGIPVFLVGHVTKEGAIAGPRVLEHIVDTVLYFEGDRGHPYRILRSIKNRFGSTNEVGVFEMRGNGLSEVASPSELFLAERPRGASGSVVVGCVEGSRPVLIELQALVSYTSFGIPRRTSLGVDYNRVSLLVAVLEKRAETSFLNQDIFVNVAGGIRIDEPAVDLGIVLALASSLRNQPVDPQLVVFGEVGLTGEVRAISQAEMRIKEAAKMGFTRCLLPKSNANQVSAAGGLELIGVDSIVKALDVL